MLRRIRGALGMAVMWAVMWGVLGLGIGLVTWYRMTLNEFPLSPSTALDLILSPSAWFAVFGAINGLLFAVVLAVAERGQSMGTVSLARFTLWGAIATLILPLLAILIVLSVFGPFEIGGVSFGSLALLAGLGMACGAVTLLIARRGKGGVGAPAA